MTKTTLTLAASVVLAVSMLAADRYEPVAGWLKLPADREQLGNMHGDIAVSSAGEVYVSTQDPAAGIQVYAADGTFVRNVARAPSDLHGFVIRQGPDGEFIYGARMFGQSVVKLGLDGSVAMTIGSSSVPDRFKTRNARSNQLAMTLTGVDVAPNGDVYVADGYASDYIHRFDRHGHYLSSFGGKQPPYSFNTLHKLTIDTRFSPARIIATDRANNRVVHLSLDGAFLGVVAEDLLLPAAVTIDGDHAIVGELTGRVTVLDRNGSVVTHVGTNTGQGVGSNKLPPADWQTGLVLAPHGVATNGAGDLFVAEFNAYGRVHRFDAR